MQRKTEFNYVFIHFFRLAGHMLILIAKRTANFIPMDVITSRTIGKLDNLNIPKKSNLYMDLTTREQLNAPREYSHFFKW